MSSVPAHGGVDRKSCEDAGRGAEEVKGGPNAYRDAEQQQHASDRLSVFFRLEFPDADLCEAQDR